LDETNTKPDRMESNQTNNPVKEGTPRQGNTWWILIIVLLVAGGIFWAIGRSHNPAPESGPVRSAAPPDQIENTVESSEELPDTSRLEERRDRESGIY